MEIQTVRITPDVKQKYVLVRVIHGGEEAIILWGNPDIEWHKDILEEITHAGYEIFEVLGGGWLLYNAEKETVHVWGKSDRLGVAPINLVREVLKIEVVEGESL